LSRQNGPRRPTRKGTMRRTPWARAHVPEIEEGGNGVRGEDEGGPWR
jgi:hypothetical protein